MRISVFNYFIPRKVSENVFAFKGCENSKCEYFISRYPYLAYFQDLGSMPIAHVASLIFIILVEESDDDAIVVQCCSRVL